MDPTFILIAVAVAAMWFMTSRTRKQQKEQSAFRDRLEPGQYVMTASGMFGTVVAVEDDAVVLEASPGLTSRWLKIAIAKVAEPPVDAADEDDDEYDEYDEYDDEYEDDAVEDDADDEDAVAYDDEVDAASDEVAAVEVEDTVVAPADEPDPAVDEADRPGPDTGTTPR